MQNGHTQKSRFSEYESEATRRTDTPDAAGSTGPDAAKEALRLVGELREYVSYMVAAKLDALKLSLRTVFMYAALGVVGGIAGISMLCYAAAQVLSGIAGGIGVLLDGHVWAGQLITGLLVLIGTAIAIVVVMGRMKSAAREATLRKYKIRKAGQKRDYGRDVQQAAHSQTP